MFDKESLIKCLQKLSFPKDEYWVLAGSAMVLYGFRPLTNDIDLGCTKSLADYLEQQGYPIEKYPNGTRKIIYEENIEIFENWLEGKVEKINDIPIVSIDGLIQMKKKLGRQKDLLDLELIEKMKK